MKNMSRQITFYTLSLQNTPIRRIDSQVSKMSYQEIKTYKYSPEVRAAMRLAQREYRALRKKKQEALAAQVHGPTAKAPEHSLQEVNANI